MSDSSNDSKTFSNFINGGIDSMFNTFDSWIGDFYNKRAEKRAFERTLQLMEENFKYAQRYAENSPQWAAKGLRDAGFNPILAVGGGVHAGNAPSSPTVSATSVGRGNRSGRYWDPLLNKQIDSISLDNKLKEDTLKTVKAENEVRRLKAEAEARVLRPERLGDPLEGDGKSVAILKDSKGFKALQKAIADDFDLRSERYVRETIDAVFRYGKDVLNLLPIFRRKEIMSTIKKTILKDKRGRVTGSEETYTQHGPID